LSRSPTTRQLAILGTSRNFCLPRAAAVYEKIQPRSHQPRRPPHPPRRGARRVCPPQRRAIAAAGSGRMPGAPGSSTRARSAAMRWSCRLDADDQLEAVANKGAKTPETPRLLLLAPTRWQGLASSPQKTRAPSRPPCPRSSRLSPGCQPAFPGWYRILRCNGVRLSYRLQYVEWDRTGQPWRARRVKRTAGL
jgi:hypothetical protein